MYTLKQHLTKGTEVSEEFAKLMPECLWMLTIFTVAFGSITLLGLISWEYFLGIMAGSAGTWMMIILSILLKAYFRVK